MKFRVKNNRTQSFEIVQQVIKYSPDWDSMKIIVEIGKQKDNTYVNIK